MGMRRPHCRAFRRAAVTFALTITIPLIVTCTVSRHGECAQHRSHHFAGTSPTSREAFVSSGAISVGGGESSSVRGTNGQFRRDGWDQQHTSSPASHSGSPTAGAFKVDVPHSAAYREGPKFRQSEDRVGPLAATSVLLHDEPIFFGGRQPITSRVVEWFLTRSILSCAKSTAGLKVEVEAHSNRAAIGGRLDTVAVQFDELVLNKLQVTGGGRFEVLGVDMLMAGLLPGPMRRLRRLRRPCEVTGSYELTNADVVSSAAIRKLVERVLNAAIKWSRIHALDSEQYEVKVNRVEIIGGKVSVQGEMVTSNIFQMSFHYSTGLSVSRGGHILHLRDPEFWWTSAGGHFPIPMPPLHSIDVDLGDRARIERLRIGGGRMSLMGRFVLSPVTPLTVSPVSKRSMVNHDLGESLSRTISNILQLRRN
ncbi:unnamed protein product [Discosporangium mesarthrocarpum]